MRACIRTYTHSIQLAIAVKGTLFTHAWDIKFCGSGRQRPTLERWRQVISPQGERELSVTLKSLYEFFFSLEKHLAIPFTLADHEFATFSAQVRRLCACVIPAGNRLSHILATPLVNHLKRSANSLVAVHFRAQNVIFGGGARMWDKR